MVDRVAIDLEGLHPDKTYAECLALCEELGLLELLTHGNTVYGRVTQNGINVLCTLLQIVSNAQEPENMLQES